MQTNRPVPIRVGVRNGLTPAAASVAGGAPLLTVNLRRKFKEKGAKNLQIRHVTYTKNMSTTLSRPV